MAPSLARCSVSAVEREEDGRWRSDVVEMEDGGGRGGGRECGVGGGMERSSDRTQRKAAKSAASAIRNEKKLRNEARRKRNAFVIYFYILDGP
jgi:hypothetical protein